MKKAVVVQTLNEFPKEFKLDELVERLMVLEKIEEGILEAKAGTTVSHSSVKKQVATLCRQLMQSAGGSLQ